MLWGEATGASAGSIFAGWLSSSDSLPGSTLLSPLMMGARRNAMHGSKQNAPKHVTIILASLEPWIQMYIRICAMMHHDPMRKQINPREMEVNYKSKMFCRMLRTVPDSPSPQGTDAIDP